MKSDELKLNFCKPLLFLVIFIVFVASLIFMLTGFSNNRKKAVYSKYAPETVKYIEQNKQGLIKIFEDYFPNEVCSSESTPECKKANGDQIASLISQDLKDWSSIVFIKATNDKILYMRLSGDVNELYAKSPNQFELLKELLAGRKDKIPWDDYTYSLSEKEIIIPVEVNGVVIGALARGIIE